MITERDRIAAMVARLKDFERECRNEAVAAISAAAEFPRLVRDSPKRFDALALSQTWLDRARILRDAVDLLNGDAHLERRWPPKSCGCGTGADYRFDPDCLHHSGLRAAARARLIGTSTP